MTNSVASAKQAVENCVSGINMLVRERLSKLRVPEAIQRSKKQNSSVIFYAPTCFTTIDHCGCCKTVQPPGWYEVEVEKNYDCFGGNLKRID